MWLLAFALAAAPPAPDEVAAGAAPTASPRSIPELRRTCEQGQLCDGRCIPWTDTCPTTVRASLAGLEHDKEDASLRATVCGPAPAPPPPPPADPGVTMAFQTLGGIVCGVTALAAGTYCNPFEPTSALPYPPPPPADPPCGEPPAADVR